MADSMIPGFASRLPQPAVTTSGQVVVERGGGRLLRTLVVVEPRR
jgi:hypothetical protein